MSQSTSADGIKIIATNRKAYHDYHIVETIEAGIALTGTEIKSVREGRVNLRDAYAVIRDGEVWLVNMHIAPYHHGHRDNHEPRRERKLLLHRKEINRLLGKVQERGWTLVPLKVYLKRNRAKVELALVRGKRLYDKRQAIARRDAERDLQRTLKEYRR
ncbi:MAG: SsrA-binding protein SmpB [Caldilineae bacterium]|nr:MAG: SsrA-binding protein SmpB [Caldilineae bacterium]